jgi:sporadic carbohydrate cluster 2OG-Fe(II) oxygenase
MMIKNNPFLSDEENTLASTYSKQGYLVGKIQEQEAVFWIRKSLINIAKEELKIKKTASEDTFLDSIHEYLTVSQLNDFRLTMIRKMNLMPGFRQNYYKVIKPYLDIIVGNEVSMQLKVNLSIQLPDDDSSLLPIHADTWSGDSPFEVVAWIPLVDCYKTKSMYILPANKYPIIEKNFKTMSDANTDDLFSSVEKDLEWLEIKYGEVLIFNQALPHGNRVNLENESRWSMNCRFKAVFTPYGDKKIGEFFEPISLKPASISGLNYNLPALD